MVALEAKDLQIIALSERIEALEDTVANLVRQSEFLLKDVKRLQDVQDSYRDLSVKTNKELRDRVKTQEDNFEILFQLVNKIKNKPIGQTDRDRAKKIDKYMEDRPDHKASYEALKGFLGVNDMLLNFAIAALKKECPDKYVTVKDKLDRRKRWLREVPRI